MIRTKSPISEIVQVKEIERESGGVPVEGDDAK
jgi:hypothetical protein